MDDDNMQYRASQLRLRSPPLESTKATQQQNRGSKLTSFQRLLISVSVPLSLSSRGNKSSNNMQKIPMTVEPTNGRVPQDDGSHKSLNMSIGKKKLHADGQNGLGRMMYQSMLVNGVQYCRRHLVLSCHLCQLEHTDLKYEVDDERQTLGLRDEHRSSIP
eukprot:scaffold219653_cov33-Cyclotella_meneghiniana.AAC.3